MMVLHAWLMTCIHDVTRAATQRKGLQQSWAEVEKMLVACAFVLANVELPACVSLPLSTQLVNYIYIYIYNFLGKLPNIVNQQLQDRLAVGVWPCLLSGLIDDETGRCCALFDAHACVPELAPASCWETSNDTG